MPRLSLPREAPRVLIQREMPSKDFQHSYWSGYCGYTDGASAGEQSIGGIQLSDSSYTDAIHAEYFVNKTFSFEVMYQPQTNTLSADTPSLKAYFLTDKLFRQHIFDGTINGFRIGAGTLDAMFFNYTSSSNQNTQINASASNILGNRGRWIHLVFAYIYDPANPAQSTVRIFVNGYKVREDQLFNGFYPVNSTFNGGAFWSFKKSGPLQICGGTSHIYKYFRVLTTNPWPADGFEIADPNNPFTGSGRWEAGINDPQPYPTIDPAAEVMKFNFHKHMTISDIRDLSQNSWPIDYIAPDALIKYAKPSRL